MAKANDQKSNMQSRPPIVVILGHVDHGKTSILDYIRKTKVAEKESGGITQHIGAYQVSHNGKLITFIDTPGHEAFSAMRSRGAKVADLAVLVVAADEGVKPQTKEAIDHITHMELPFVVAMNKADKPGIIAEKVKKQLADNNVLVESLGGKVPLVATSAKTGVGIDDLLEMILLLAEMSELKADYSVPASGIIIESFLDTQRGPTATLLVQQGTLQAKDAIATESTYGTAKMMEDFKGQVVEKAEPSMAVRLTGLVQLPRMGEEWEVMENMDAAKEKAVQKSEVEKKKREPAKVLEISPEQKVFNLILKADVFGSLEALGGVLQAIPQEEVVLRTISNEVGEVNEADVKLASSAKADIFGFRIKTGQIAGNLAQRTGVRIFNFDVIYELVKAVREQMGRQLEPEIVRQDLGEVKILGIFKQNGSRQIIGGRVAKGKAERGALAEVLRQGEKIGKGKVVQLQANKADVESCQKDKECGILFEGEPVVEKGDILVFFREEKKKREL
ncbi:MAG: translation initiation factor IF-2 [bacterium]